MNEPLMSELTPEARQAKLDELKAAFDRDGCFVYRGVLRYWGTFCDLADGRFPGTERYICYAVTLK